MHTVSEFLTGSGIATETPQPIIAPNQIRQSYHGAKIRCNSGTIFVGRQNVTTENGFLLSADEKLSLPIDDPSKVFVVGDGTYSWILA